jgi:hypothetical protein
LKLAEDIELAQIIARLATDARLEVKAEIPGFLAHRAITSLFHFTSVKNLESIIKHGFLGRELLMDLGIEFFTSDLARDEPVLNGVCFSLSRPNHYMAARKISSGHQMVLLELQGLDDLLSNHGFIAIPGNFGSPILKSELENWPEKFIGGEGLSNLFNSPTTRSKYSIPEFEPTDPQAEIIILDPLPWSFVKRIYIPNSTQFVVENQIREVIQRLPLGIVLSSQVSDVFPEIDWTDHEVRTEYNERRWIENWRG